MKCFTIKNLQKIKNSYSSEKLEVVSVENIDNAITQEGLEIIENKGI